MIQRSVTRLKDTFNPPHTYHIVLGHNAGGEVSLQAHHTYHIVIIKHNAGREAKLAYPSNTPYILEDSKARININ
jgi:hypothetical protein